jgi:hypothetical protein
MNVHRNGVTAGSGAGRTVATLDAEVARKKTGLGSLFELSRTKIVLFWGALALVVLLVVIACLLPKPPAT